MSIGSRYLPRSLSLRFRHRVSAAFIVASLVGASSCNQSSTSGSREGPRVGVAFVPLETHTTAEAAQTVAHMELTGLVFLPEDRGLLVWEKGGRVSHYRPDPDGLALQGEFRLDDIATNTDCGLISIALDPDWETNHFVYAAHCISVTHSAVTRYEFHGDDYGRVARSAARVIEFGDREAKKGWHNVGTIGFFPDPEHSLWILTGEKKNPENAQDPSTNLGGILRIIPNRDAAGGYEPHPENPFGGPGSDPTRESSPDLYAWGFRSPWRGAVDNSGRVWVGEVGNAIEEINLVSAPGQNFGWGDADGPCKPKPGYSCKSLTDPIAWWGRGSNHHYRLEDESAGPTVRRVAWVGTPYQTNESDPYDGFLNDSTLIADMCVGFVRALSVDDRGKVVRDEAVGHLIGLSGAAQAPDGSLYVTSFGACTSDSFGVGGGIYRVVLDRRDSRAEPELPKPSCEPLVNEPLGPVPLKLADTGIFADAKHTKPIARAIPYEPSLPLWTNGSDKERWLLLPEGAQIDNSRRDHWKFPVGTLFFKTFSYGDANQSVRVETRIIRRTRDGWDYHAYKWKGSDADLLSLERALPVTNKPSDALKFTHEIPSRFDCRSCHESNETIVIGFDELRLSGDGDGTGSQLEALAELGVFKKPVPSNPDRVVHEDPTTREVLGYLHGNCAHCHNPSENSMSALDLSYSHALANIVLKETEGSGQASGVRIVPGAPEQSVLFLAMSGEGDDPELQDMPPVGVQVRDAAAIERMRQWISALQP
jgi:glucose/arabinose dehydrogenase